MPSSAHHHYRSAPAPLLLVSATTAADAFFAAFPAQLAPCPKVQQHHQQRRHSYPATPPSKARGGDDGYLAAESEGDAGEGAGEELRDCVIVGAGVAGLAAAVDLERAGSDFVLLEAADRLGGRIFTHKESQSRYNHQREEGGVSNNSSGSDDIGRPLELGAQWLHGTEGNPLFDFCVEEGLFDSQEGEAELALAKRAYTAGGFQARRPDGTKVSRREFIRHSDAWSKAVLEAEMLYETSLQANDEGGGAHEQPPTSSENIRGTTQTASTLGETQASTNAALGDPTTNDRFGKQDEVGTFLHRRVREILRAGTGGGEQGEGRADIDEGVLGYLLRKQHAVEGCDDLNRVAASGYGMYEELCGGDVRVPGGFSRVVDALAGKISPDRVRVNSPVTLVQWATEKGGEGGAGEGEGGAAASSVKTYRDSHPSHPCVVEYSTTRNRGISGAGCGKEKVEGVTRRVRCKRVVVTVGLGVLKNGMSLAFSPPLPPAKLSAIRRLGFGTTDKIFVRCTRERGAGGDRAGPDPSLHVGVLRPATEQQAQQLPRQQGRDTNIRDVPPPWIDDIFSFAAEGEYVYSWLTGPSARAVEIAAPAEEVTHELLSLLRTTTQDPSWQEAPETEEIRGGGGYASGRIPGQEGGMPSLALPPLLQARDTAVVRSPATLVRSDWNSNPLFRGSYSYIATGSSPADMEELARPLSVSASEETDAVCCSSEDVEARGAGARPVSSARVIFAGEAMHQQFFSTAHGGFETGRRAAREVLASCGCEGAAEAGDALMQKTTEYTPAAF